MDTDVLNLQPTGWEQVTRNVAESSLSSTGIEQLALSSFAHLLYSTARNNDPGIADENDVRKEARLLMSLSCASPDVVTIASGRITPPSDASSCYSSGSVSRRDSFSFSCPSLSLENHSQGFEESFQDNDDEQSLKHRPPAVLLGRVLKVDDRDAYRLSSEAMARNIMQSYQKAIQWRIDSWVDSLSRVLLNKERILKEQHESAERIKELLLAPEAKLILKLRELATRVRVLDACTSFKVLPQRMPKNDDSGPPVKRPRIETDDEDPTGLEETEYEYHVAHLLTLDVELNILSPGVGYIQIELQVPGTIDGTFLSIQDGADHLTDVIINLNTDILASMIEKSSRTIVRSSIEAVINDKPVEVITEKSDVKGRKAESTIDPSPVPLITPKRKLSEDKVSGIAIVTPREASSPSSFGESDEDKPVILSIPDNFSKDQPKSMLTPHPSRGRDAGNFTFASRLPMKKEMQLPTVVTPHKTALSFVEGKGPCPNLPTLVEVACRAMHTK